MVNKPRIDFYAKPFLLTIAVLLVNYYVTYGLNIGYSYVFFDFIKVSIFYNFIKLSVYIVIGYIFWDERGKSFLLIIVLSVFVFFIEHVLFHVFHLVLSHNSNVVGDVFPTLIGSFLFFIPFIVLLLYLGRALKRVLTKKENNNKGQTTV